VHTFSNRHSENRVGHFINGCVVAVRLVGRTATRWINRFLYMWRKLHFNRDSTSLYVFWQSFFRDWFWLQFDVLMSKCPITCFRLDFWFILAELSEIWVYTRSILRLSSRLHHPPTDKIVGLRLMSRCQFWGISLFHSLSIPIIQWCKRFFITTKRWWNYLKSHE